MKKRIVLLAITLLSLFFGATAFAQVRVACVGDSINAVLKLKES